MKIGILTYHFVANFGANLQTLSTFGYFQKSVHTPIIINWIPKDLEDYYNKVVPAEQLEAFHQFAKKNYINISKICRSSKDVAKVIDAEKIDLVVIGSDAVLTYIPFFQRFHICKYGLKYMKPCIDSDFPNAFWGDFLRYTHYPTKLVLMSASAQNTKYFAIYFRKKKFEKALNAFSYISVRDVWTKKMIAYLTKNRLDVKITPDPVFAFNYNIGKQYTRDYILQKFGLNENYALFSVCSNLISANWKKQLEEEFRKNGIILYELPQANKKQKNELSNILHFPIDPIEWYCLIKYARAYIGELMHPILVALHNSTPIFAVDTYGFKSKNGQFGIMPESSKTYQIINRFNLLDNYWNVNSQTEIGSPDNIVDKILTFDATECKKNALVLYDEYQCMLNEILSTVS